MPCPRQGAVNVLLVDQLLGPSFQAVTYVLWCMTCLLRSLQGILAREVASWMLVGVTILLISAYRQEQSLVQLSGSAPMRHMLPIMIWQGHTSQFHYLRHGA
ncbi:hypothetical protein AB1Y20_001686 [Prymnesium parvum]